MKNCYPTILYFKVHEPASYDDTDIEKYRCSQVKTLIYYNAHRDILVI